MANALALPQDDMAQQQQQPPKPQAPVTPKPASPAPLAMAGQVTPQQPVPIPQTADPLAFAPTPTPGAPLTNPVPATPSVAPAPAPTTSVQDWQSYSPLTGKTEAEKAAALEKNASVLGRAPMDFSGYQVANSPTGILNASGVMGYKPDAEKIRSLDAIANHVDTTAKDQAAALGQYNAGNQGINFAQANTDADADIAQRVKEGGIGDSSAVREQILRDSGFGSGGEFLGAPDNHAVPGFPAGYDPSKAVLPQSNVPGSAPLSSAAPSNNVALSEINPEDSLISKEITPGQNIDRVKTFQDALNSTVKNVIDPAYETSARNLNRYNFGAGRGVSGEARTSQGNLADVRERRIADLSAQGIADATRGSIDDNYRNLDETQQERGYQADRADTAFNQDAELALLREQLTNGAFGRASAQQNAGYANGPEDIELILSRIFGDQSSQAGRAAAESFRNAGSNSGSNSGGSYADILKLIEQYRRGMGGSQPADDGGYEVTPE